MNPNKPNSTYNIDDAELASLADGKMTLGPQIVSTISESAYVLPSLTTSNTTHYGLYKSNLDFGFDSIDGSFRQSESDKKSSNDDVLMRDSCCMKKDQIGLGVRKRGKEKRNARRNKRLMVKTSRAGSNRESTRSNDICGNLKSEKRHKREFQRRKTIERTQRIEKKRKHKKDMLSLRQSIGLLKFA